MCFPFEKLAKTPRSSDKCFFRLARRQEPKQSWRETKKKNKKKRNHQNLDETETQTLLSYPNSNPKRLQNIIFFRGFLYAFSPIFFRKHFHPLSFFCFFFLGVMLEGQTLSFQVLWQFCVFAYNFV